MDPALQEGLLSPPALAVLGLCIGSFLNVVIHRLPLMLERGWKIDSAQMLGLDPAKTPAIGAPLTLSRPRSQCPKCGHAIAWHENIPLLGYLRLGGRCSACKTRISPRYPIVELATALLFAAIGWRFGAQPAALLWCGFAAVLIALTGIDWDTTLLPDDLTLPLLWAGLVVAALGWTLPLTQALWGAVAGYLSLWSVYWAFKLATGKEGMGHGDFKLLAALGAWLGGADDPAHRPRRLRARRRGRPRDEGERRPARGPLRPLRPLSRRLGSGRAAGRLRARARLAGLGLMAPAARR